MTIGPYVYGSPELKAIALAVGIITVWTAIRYRWWRVFSRRTPPGNNPSQ